MPGRPAAAAASPSIPSGSVVIARIRAHAYVLVLGAVIGGAAAVAAILSADTSFAATSTLLVRQASSPSPAVATNSMRAVILNHRVASAVVKDLSLPVTPARLLQKVQVSDVPGTYLLRLTVIDRDPAQAARVANAIARASIVLNETLTRTGDDKLQNVMASELAAARKRMNEAEKALNDFRSERARTPAPLHVAEIEGARLHGEYDLAARLYEEIAVQYGKLRLAVAEQAAELLVIEDAYPPETPLQYPITSRLVTGIASGFMLALLFTVLFAVFAPVRQPPV